MTAVPVFVVDLIPVPLVGTAVDVPGWGDVQKCQTCKRAYDASLQPGCLHTSEPLCPACVDATCWRCSQPGSQVGEL